jgi:hypothetical protein
VYTANISGIPADISSVGEFPSLSVNSRGLFYQFIGFERGKKEQELKK